MYISLAKQTNALFAFALSAMLFSSAVLFPLSAAAQSAADVLNGIGSVFVVVSPQFPKPNDELTARLTSTAVDLDRATISWSADGSEIEKGVGKKEVRFFVGGLGEKTVLTVVITPRQGSPIARTTIVTPATVDLLWQARSYTPPFYQGKALHATDGSVLLVAMPQLTVPGGSRLPADELIYTWEENGRVLGSQSGRGKQSLVVQASRRFIPRRFEVRAESPDRSLIAHDQVVIRPVEPFVLFYENHPTLGMLYDHALFKTTELVEDEATVVAEPYFFSSENRDSETFAYAWSVDGTTVDPQRRQESMLTLRQEGGKGRASVGVSLRHLEQLLQTSASGFAIMFGEDRNDSGSAF